MTSSADTKAPGPTANPASTATMQPETRPSGAEVRPQPMAPTGPAAGVQPSPQPEPRSDAPVAPQPASQPHVAASHATATGAAAPAKQHVQASPPPAATQPPPGPSRGRRFVRSVFSHLLFAGITVAGVLGYLYHDPILRDVSNTVCADQVLGQWMGPPKISTAAAPKPVATAAQTATAPPPPHASTSPATAAVPAASPTASAVKPVTAPASPPAEAPAAAAQQPAATVSPGPITAAPAAIAATAPAASAAVPAKNEPVAATASVNAPKTAALAPAAPAAPSSAGSDLEQAWTAARRAFADGKPEAADAYRSLAQRYPNNPDLTGELGNILFQQGKLDEAGDMFLETGLRLIRRKQEPRAACLAEVLQKFAPQKAADLAKRAGVPCPVSSTSNQR